MTKNEKHEIAVAVKCLIDENDEDSKTLKSLYEKKNGSLKGFRKYVRNECVEFWTDFEPYLDEAYLDYAHVIVGKKIVNLDDLWVFIRDGLEGK